MMTSLSMVEAKLPPGFRFHPRDEELVCDYLMKKIAGSQQLPPFLLEVDLNKSEPWEIPDSACVGGKDWYFYSQRDRKYATGLRTNRATVSGYWKATGKDRPVVAKGGGLVGMRKTLVFYEGRAPKGKKTDWVMHEFRLEGALSSLATVSSPSSKDDWVLCRVFHKSKQIGTTKLHGIGSISCNSIGSYEQEDDKPYSNFSSLPPLMEQPYITFDQSHAINDNNNETPTTDHFQQVPCFSIFTSDQISQPPFSQNTNTIFPNENNNPIFGGFMLPENIATYSVSSSSSCDNNKDVVKAVLDHLARIETNNNDAYMKDQSPRFGEENSEIFLSEIGLPTSVWNNQY